MIVYSTLTPEQIDLSRTRALGVEDFPVISGDKLPVNFAMGKDELKDVIDRTQFAVSTEETRYYLNMILLNRNTKISEQTVKETTVVLNVLNFSIM